MKTCNYLSESIVLITPAAGEPYKAKLVTEYGRNATGGLIVVSTRYVDAKNEVITIGATDEAEIKSPGQPLSAQSDCITVTEQAVCIDEAPAKMVTEYGRNNIGALIVVSTRYVDAANAVINAASALVIKYGNCGNEATNSSSTKTATFVSTENQTAFTIPETPTSILMMMRNGIGLDPSATTLAGDVVTYNPAQNNGSPLLAGNRITVVYTIGSPATGGSLQALANSLATLIPDALDA
jgi:uncharacterized protein (DUF433 family)